MKKIWLIIVIIMALLVGFWFVGKNSNSNVARSKDPQNTGSKTLVALVDLDSDSDGLKDWEETLWETDPNNPDSDYDGTSDGEEIKLNRNPMIAGPDDLITVKEKTSTEETGKADNENLTGTDLFARNFFSNYLSISDDNFAVSPEKQSFLVSQILGEVTQEKSFFQKYASDDLLILGQEINSDLRKKYGANVSVALATGYEILPETDEVLIIQSALASKDPDKFNDLDLVIQSYKKTSELLLAVVVPSDIAVIHLDLINTFETMAASLLNIKDSLNDPLSGMLALGEYKKNSEKIPGLIMSLANYFDKNNIVFFPGEPGEGFNNLANRR